MMHKQWMMARTSTHSEPKIMNPTSLGGGGKYIFTRSTAANAPRIKVESKSFGKGCHRTASFNVHADPRQRDHPKSALHFHLHTLVQGCERKRRCSYHFKWGPPPSGDRYGKQAEQVISICMPHNQMTELVFRMTIPREARATKKKKYARQFGSNQPREQNERTSIPSSFYRRGVCFWLLLLLWACAAICSVLGDLLGEMLTNGWQAALLSRVATRGTRQRRAIQS